MAKIYKRPYIFAAAVPLACTALFFHISVNTLQGDYGRFAELDAEFENQQLHADLTALQDEIDRTQNLTRRLSDDFLDLDLLDQQARAVLGLIRSDEIVLR
jgi:cell division protein FtsB